MATLQVLVIDDEPAVRQVLAAAVGRAGYVVSQAGSATEAATKLARGEVDVALCDIQMPDMNGIELVRQTRASGCETTFIMVTAFASMDTAIEAIRAGAADYIIKPVRNEDLLHRLRQIEAIRGLRDENKTLRRFVMGSREDRYRFASPAMAATERLVSKVAPTESTVLVTGESGTGKGVIARQIHELSPRQEGPFIPVNCSAIPENLMESEFFGHTKGAFTSADRARKGLFLQADGGTLFLDEIGELPLGMQTKLLHVIEDKQVRPVGGEQVRTVDTRIVAATNRNLSEMVKDGRFREDLYFRLSVFHIPVPALRERRADIPGLIRYLLARTRVSPGRRLGIARDAEEALAGYGWPGNVRELENVISRACILAEGDEITLADLPPEIMRIAPVTASIGTPIASSSLPLKEQVRRFEAGVVLRSIDECSGDRRAAAQKLGIGLSSLYRKLEEYEQDGIIPAEGRGSALRSTA